MKFIKVVIALSLVGLFAVGCSADNQASTSSDGSDQTIYTTIYPLQYVIEQIGGETVNVESVYPAGADAHTYEPTSKDMTAIAESDAFIYLGAGMEAFAETVADALGSEDVSLIEIGEHEELFIEYVGDHVHTNGDEEAHTHHHGEGESGGHEDETQEEHAGHSHDGHNHGDHDPHIWLDPLRMIEVAEIIKDELTALNPSKEADYNENFEILRSNLIALDDQYTEVLGEKEDKQVLVSHAAFGYWEERYGIEQIAVNGLSTENEPSQKELTEIIDQAKERNLDFILFEQNSSNRVSKVIQEEVGLEPLTIHTLEVLSEEDITNNEDYITLMQRNLEVLTKALSESPPGSKDSSKIREQTSESHKHESEHDHDHEHDHSHAHDVEAAKIYEGYFEDSQVKDRSLSDWEGDWQSVYPYLQDGTLDEVFASKAEHEGDMTAKEYKKYYKKGYKTDVGRIVIKGATITFFQNGEQRSGEYTYDGYEILTYDAGNRGVRYIFKLKEKAEGLPQYIQFSDHSIYPTDANHYHLYWGDDRKELLDEVTNWPTYYPSEMSGHEISHEMMAHE